MALLTYWGLAHPAYAAAPLVAVGRRGLCGQTLTLTLALALTLTLALALVPYCGCRSGVDRTVTRRTHYLLTTCSLPAHYLLANCSLTAYSLLPNCLPGAAVAGGGRRARWAGRRRSPNYLLTTY
jgi:hypothetical protein